MRQIRKVKLPKDEGLVAIELPEGAKFEAFRREKPNAAYAYVNAEWPKVPSPGFDPDTSCYEQHSLFLCRLGEDIPNAVYSADDPESDMAHVNDDIWVFFVRKPDE